ncbi:MAG: glycosyl transferase group 1 [Pseudonocardiales bacterium]|nr:glycosyl transferase group 1 [Pseudonocardiales bacterium]
MLRVMQSYVALRDTSNPYLVDLAESLDGHVRVLNFSWRRALAGRYDVFHVHWPEYLVRDRNMVRTSARLLLFTAVLVRIRLGRRALVRTRHNAQPHEAGSRVESWALELCDRWTTLWIALNTATAPPAGQASVIIPLGHQRRRLQGVRLGQPVCGRILNFGLLRGYKGIDALLAAFADVEGGSAHLRIVGKPYDDVTATRVAEAARRDSRISVRLEFLPEPELAVEVSAADLVVLPYQYMQNSGAAIFALSVGRPLLVPGNALNDALAHEVGEQWILRYDGDLEAHTLRWALDQLRADPPIGQPDLSLRDWPTIGAAHTAAYEQAAELARARRGG